MHWQTFISTLAGGLITYSAILLTNALDLGKRKRTHEKLIHALLQGLQDEIAGLLEMAETSPVTGDKLINFARHECDRLHVP